MLFSVNLVPRTLPPPWEEGCVIVELVLNWKNFELRSLLLSETTLKQSEIQASCAVFYRNSLLVAIRCYNAQISGFN